ncbi:MAG: chromosomal replication initiator protein DnaA [Candidatus Sumerlaeaceae bacterium]|jgi:chromosomal replication initiator protein
MIEIREKKMESAASKEVWGKVLEELGRVLDRDSMATWIAVLQCQSIDGNKLLLSAPSEFHRAWILSNYGDQLRQAVKNVVSDEAAIELVAMPALVVDRSFDPLPITPARAADGVIPSAANATPLPAFPRICRLNPRYTFEEYVVGESNRFAHAACRQVADPSSKSFNPLFLYGGVGLGKTHLLHAIGHQVMRTNPHMKVLYVTSDEFMNSFIESITQGKQAEFREYYRRVDVLLIDDVQFFSGKERTQVEFFHTFNALYDAGKKIVVSSDRPPNELDKLEDRLRNRFAWGLVVDIQPPDLEMRIAILNKKFAAMGEGELPRSVALYIAERVQKNIRELEGVLLKLRTYAAVMKQPITVELAKSILSDVMPPSPPQTLHAEQIIQVVCQNFGIGREDLLGQNRKKRLATPRHVAMFLVRKFTKLSYPEIGEVFGGRDHTSVLHAFRRISEQIEKDENMRSLIAYLSRQLNEMRQD